MPAPETISAVSRANSALPWRASYPITTGPDACRARRYAVSPAAVRPLYLRRPDAELDREKRLRKMLIDPRW